jgi:hypothetical protein
MSNDRLQQAAARCSFPQRLSTSLLNGIFQWLQPFEHCQLAAACKRLREVGQDEQSWTLLMRVWIQLYGLRITTCDWSLAVDFCDGARRALIDNGTDPVQDTELALATQWTHYEISGFSATVSIDKRRSASWWSAWKLHEVDDPSGLGFWRHVVHLLTLDDLEVYRAHIKVKENQESSLWEAVESRLIVRAQHGSPVAVLCLLRLLTQQNHLSTVNVADLKNLVDRRTMTMGLWTSKFDSGFQQECTRYRPTRLSTRQKLETVGTRLVKKLLCCDAVGI